MLIEVLFTDSGNFLRDICRDDEVFHRVQQWLYSNWNGVAATKLADKIYIIMNHDH